MEDKTMNNEQALQLREFAIKWITKVIAKRKDYREKLLAIIDNIIPEDIEQHDAYNVLECRDWSCGNDRYNGFGDLLFDYWDGFYDGTFSEKVKTDISCAFGIGIDLYIKQSGGVVGFTVGDLRKVFDNNIPQFIQEYYPGIDSASDSDSIWL